MRCRSRGLQCQLDRVIDEALKDPTEERIKSLVRLSRQQGHGSIYARIRARARLLRDASPSACAKQIVGTQKLLCRVVDTQAPNGWCLGWSDGSSIYAEERRYAGLGGLVHNEQGDRIATVSDFRAGLDAFQAELQAFCAVLRAALANGIRRLIMHIDCQALAHLFMNRPDDPRMRDACALARQFHALRIEVIPRRANVMADRLAKRAAQSQFAAQALN